MALDSVFLCIYMIEAMLKIIAQGFLYFSNTWNKLGGCRWRVCGRVSVLVLAWANVSVG